MIPEDVMKELRYMVKTTWVTYGALEYRDDAEALRHDAGL